MIHRGKMRLVSLLALLLCGAAAFAQEQLPADVRVTIDAGVATALARTGTPSASIAIVKGGKIVYAHAYGIAQLEGKVPATTEMRYAIGSVSKQFTATAVLLLAEDGKLSLDDKVGKWLPDLTRANDITIRQLLSMTAGYQDYWPQDYVFKQMLNPIEPAEILAQWAKKPLDFEPGSRWQYSNTNYVAAGLIVQKASGMGLVEFLHKRVFDPLQMTSVADDDRAPLPKEDASRYVRYALGSVRPAPKEGAGWIFAAGELAMTPSDLARWDISVIDQTVLKPASYKTMQTEMRLTDGSGARYGLGVQTVVTDGHRTVRHSGAVSGFIAQNVIFPDDRSAVVVLANLDSATSGAEIANQLIRVVLAPAAKPAKGEDAEFTHKVHEIFEGLQQGTIDRSLFSDNCNTYFSDATVKDFAASLAPLGKPTGVAFTGDQLRGGMHFRGFYVQFAGREPLHVTTYTLNDGKIEQFMVME